MTDLPSLEVVYRAAHGLVVVKGDGLEVIAFSTVDTQAGRDGEDFISYCECFGLRGQGENEREARESLAECLTQVLHAYRAAGRLSDVLCAPTWRRIELSEADLPALLKDLASCGEIVCAEVKPSQPSQGGASPSRVHEGTHRRPVSQAA